jgi:hypothetical protein
MCVVVYESVFDGAGIFCRDFGAQKEQNVGKLRLGRGLFGRLAPPSLGHLLLLWLLLCHKDTHIAYHFAHTTAHAPSHLPSLPTGTIATRLDLIAVN